MILFDRRLFKVFPYRINLDSNYLYQLIITRAETKIVRHSPKREATDILLETIPNNFIMKMLEFWNTKQFPLPTFLVKTPRMNFKFETGTEIFADSSSYRFSYRTDMEPEFKCSRILFDTAMHEYPFSLREMIKKTFLNEITDEKIKNKHFFNGISSLELGEEIGMKLIERYVLKNNVSLNELTALLANEENEDEDENENRENMYREISL